MSLALHLARGGTVTVPNASRPEQWRLCTECGHRAGLHDNRTMRCTAHQLGRPCRCVGWSHAS